MAELYRGVPIVVTPGFNPVDWCRIVETYGVTHACIAPPICLALLHHPGKYTAHIQSRIRLTLLFFTEAVSEYDLSSLEYLLSGAAPLSLSLLEAFNSRLRSRGADVAVIQGSIHDLQYQ